MRFRTRHGIALRSGRGQGKVWFRASTGAKDIKSAVCISSFVTFIAVHYIRIINFWVDAYKYSAGKFVGRTMEMQNPCLNGIASNDANRHMLLQPLHSVLQLEGQRIKVQCG